MRLPTASKSFAMRSKDFRSARSSSSMAGMAMTACRFSSMLSLSYSSRRASICWHSRSVSFLSRSFAASACCAWFRLSSRAEILSARLRPLSSISALMEAERPCAAVRAAFIPLRMVRRDFLSEARRSAFSA